MIRLGIGWLSLAALVLLTYIGCKKGAMAAAFFESVAYLC